MEPDSGRGGEVRGLMTPMVGEGASRLRRGGIGDLGPLLSAPVEGRMIDAPWLAVVWRAVMEPLRSATSEAVLGPDAAETVRMRLAGKEWRPRS